MLGSCVTSKRKSKETTLWTDDRIYQTWAYIFNIFHAVVLLAALTPSARGLSFN